MRVTRRRHCQKWSHSSWSLSWRSIVIALLVQIATVFCVVDTQNFLYSNFVYNIVKNSPTRQITFRLPSVLVYSLSLLYPLWISLYCFLCKKSKRSLYFLWVWSCDVFQLVIFIDHFVGFYHPFHFTISFHIQTQLLSFFFVMISDFILGRKLIRKKQFFNFPRTN